MNLRTFFICSRRIGTSNGHGVVDAPIHNEHERHQPEEEFLFVAVPVILKLWQNN